MTLSSINERALVRNLEELRNPVKKFPSTDAAQANGHSFVRRASGVHLATSTPMTDAVPDLELLELRALLDDRQASSAELTAAFLDRIDRLDPVLHAVVHLTADLAREQAARADEELAAGRHRGPLHGVPIAVKDVVDIAGTPTTAGMPMRRDHRADADATLVRRLREAGAVVLGKLALTEGVYAEHRAPYRAPVNPWSAAHWAGASSSGSGVAVAAGLCAAALGSDTGASIRLPSAVNGVTGIRPTYGRVSRQGVFELAATLDQIGPMARSVADAAAVLQVIAGRDPADPTTSVHAPQDYLADDPVVDVLRIGLDPAFALGDVDAATAACLEETVDVFSELGAEIHPIHFPDSAQIVDDWFGVCAAQAAVAHRRTFPSRRAEYGPALADLLDRGNRMTAVEHQELLLRRANFRGEVEELFTEIDLVLLPVLAFTTPTAAEMDRMDDRHISGVHRFTCPFPMSGSPTLTFPAGATPDGLPIGMQLAGPHLREDLLVRAGRAFQRATSWHRRRPRLP
jgi:amidase